MKNKLIPIFFEHIPYCQKYLQEYHPDITDIIYNGIVDFTPQFYAAVKNNVPEANYIDIIDMASILAKEAIDYKKKTVEELDFQGKDKKVIIYARCKCNEIDGLIRVLLTMIDSAYIYMNKF